MTTCLPLQPINPINQLLLDVFGENFSPPFNAGFQPTNKEQMILEPLLQMQFPGGGKIMPPGEPHKSMAELLSGITGQLGPIFAFFGPLFLILDLIRAIIDIICAMLNPDAMIKSIIDMFLSVIPPIIALYPPISAILLALNTVKFIIALIVAMASMIIAIIDEIVALALLIADLILNGAIKAIDAITAKICMLLQNFANQIGGALAPVSFIIELLDLFMSLGAKFFCAGDAACCDDDNCPTVVMSPPIGIATILEKLEAFGLSSLGLADPEHDVIFRQPSLSIYDPSNFDIENLVPYIILGDTISETSNENVTIRVKITKRDENGDVEQTATLPLYKVESGTLFVRGDSFDAGDIVEYEVIPDQSALIGKGLIGLGCHDDIRASAGGVRELINENIDAAAATGGSGSDAQGAGAAEGFSGLDPLATKLGRSFPPLPTAALNACLAAQTADPSVSQADCIMATVSDYLDDLTDFYEDVVCVGASRTKSTFELSKSFAISDGVDFATIILSISDISGANLLTGGPPNASFDANFSATGGTIGPVVYNSATGVFMANITASKPGIVEITGNFLVRGRTCLRPGKFDGFNVTDKVLSLEFLPTGGAYKRRRSGDKRQYIPSAGGRRR